MESKRRLAFWSAFGCLLRPHICLSTWCLPVQGKRWSGRERVGRGKRNGAVEPTILTCVFFMGQVEISRRGWAEVFLTCLLHSSSAFEVDYQELELEGELETADWTQTNFSCQEAVDKGALENLPKTSHMCSSSGQHWGVCLTEGTDSQSASAREATTTHDGKTAADPCYRDIGPVPPIRSSGHEDPGPQVYKGMGQ